MKTPADVLGDLKNAPVKKNGLACCDCGTGIHAAVTPFGKLPMDGDYFGGKLYCEKCHSEHRQDHWIEARRQRWSHYFTSLPVRFRGANKETIEPARWEVVKKWLLDQSSWCLVLTGAPGRGKTHLAYAIALEAFKYQFDDKGETIAPIVVRCADLVVRLQSAGTEFGAVPHAEFPGLLVLDDLGAEKATEFAVQQFYRLICHREAEMLKTIFTSNLSLDAIGKRFHDRIVSRMQSGEILKMSGPDRRLK